MPFCLVFWDSEDVETEPPVERHNGASQQQRTALVMKHLVAYSNKAVPRQWWACN